MSSQLKFTLILASNSPQRKKLLSYLDIPFKIIPANIKEESNNSDPCEIAMDIASKKADVIWNTCNDIKAPFIVAADTLVVLNRKIYGKPNNNDDAFKILENLSNKSHQVITGVAIYFKDKENNIVKDKFNKCSIVTFRKLDKQIIEDYIHSKEGENKAGGYAIQGKAQSFVSSINGCYSNIVGFPLAEFTKKLEYLLSNKWYKYFTDHK